MYYNNNFLRITHTIIQNVKVINLLLQYFCYFVNHNMYLINEIRKQVLNIFIKNFYFFHNPPQFVFNTHYNFCFSKINILCIMTIMFKIWTLFITMLFTQLLVRAGILLTRGKHLHDHIIPLRGEGPIN